MHVGDSCWWHVCVACEWFVRQCHTAAKFLETVQSAHHGLRGLWSVYGDNGSTGEIGRTVDLYIAVLKIMDFEGKPIWCMYLVCGSFLHALFLPRCNDSSRSFSTWCPETVPTNSFKATVMRLKLSGSLTNRSWINSTIISGWQDVCQASQHRISDVQR